MGASLFSVLRLLGASFAVLLLALAPVRPAQAESLSLGEESSYSLGRHVEAWVADDRSATFDDALRAHEEGRFERPDTDRPYYGFSEGAVWARWRLANQGPAEDFVLDLNTAIFDEATLHVVRADGTIQKIVTGDSLPFAERGVPYRNLNFSLPLAEGETADLFLRVATAGNVILAPTLWQEGGFWNWVTNEYSVFGLFYGALLVMALYNAFLFVALRDRSYLYYVLYIGSLVVFQASIDGVSFQYLWPDSPWWYNQTIQLFIGLTFVFALAFSRRFLNTPILLPVFDKFIRFGVALSLIQLALLPFDRRLSILLTMPAGLLVTVCVLYAGIAAWRKGYSPARFYLLAWLVLMIGHTMGILKEMGVLPLSPITAHGSRLGAAIEVVLLSFALADRINVMRREKNQAQAVALETEREAAETQKRMADSFARFVPKQFLQLLGGSSIADVGL